MICKVNTLKLRFVVRDDDVRSELIEGFTNLIIELDVFVVVSFLTCAFSIHPNLSPLVVDCMWLLRMIPHTEINNVLSIMC